MAWTDQLFARLADQIPCGYHVGGSPASEPTALAALALASFGRWDDAQAAVNWLARQQEKDGSVGPMPGQSTPGWPTSLALTAAQYVATRSGQAKSPFNRQAAIEWLCQARGESLQRNGTMAHDTTIVAWPWVLDTHSWVEPTAMAVLALAAVGRGGDPRASEGRRMLFDRLLPSGGCNYGNTIVLGQELRPHLQPTGLALLALRGEPDPSGRIAKSLDYLSRELTPTTATASLSYGLMALAAYGRRPNDADAWLNAAYQRTVNREASPHRLALIALGVAGWPFPSD